MAKFDDAAFSRGFNQGWEAAKVLEWKPLHELEEGKDVMRRAENYESLGYWCGLKSGQENIKPVEQPLSDDAGMLISYE